MIRYSVFSLLFGWWMISSCSLLEDGESSQKIILKSKTHIENTIKWNDFFTDEEEIHFSYPDSTFELLSIGSFLINKDGDYIIPDGSSNAIKRFTKNGQFLQIIGKWGGEGPGEFSAFGTFTLNNKNDLLIFDLSTYRLSKFEFPHYLFRDNIRLQVRPNSMIVAPQGQLITYSYSEYMLNKWDASGNFLKKVFKPTESLRQFNFRFNLGGIADNNGKGFFFIYPENYEIRYYDYDLGLNMVLKPESNSRFHPSVSKLPKELSPFSFSPSHSKWWDSFLHVANIYNLGNNFVGVSLYESEKMSYKSFYFNVYNISEKTIYAEGLKVPRDGIVLYAKDGHVYIVVAPQIGEKGQIIPSKLYRYKIKTLKN